MHSRVSTRRAPARAWPWGVLEWGYANLSAALGPHTRLRVPATMASRGRTRLSPLRSLVPWQVLGVGSMRSDDDARMSHDHEMIKLGTGDTSDTAVRTEIVSGSGVRHRGMPSFLFASRNKMVNARLRFAVRL